MPIPLEYGYFLVPRRWMDNPHLKDGLFTDHLAFLWSLEQAAFVDHEQAFNGVPYRVERGEFVTSYAKMAERFGWTIKRVRGLVSRMRKAGLWATRGAYKGKTAPTIITICNYETMQEINSYYLANEGKARAKRRQREGREQKERRTQGITNGDERVAAALGSDLFRVRPDSFPGFHASADEHDDG
jgi:hypothetical protein